jgi:hypothetical protein
MSLIIENQLINKKSSIQYYDETTDLFIELTQNNINKYYKDVYILAKKNNDPIPIEFYCLNVDESIYKQVLSNLIIYKVSISIILKNIKYLNKIILLSDVDIQQYNIFNYTLGIKNIVLPILNINFSDLKLYLDQYNISCSIDNIYKFILINNYLGCKNNVYDLIENIRETKYWSLQKNCLLSLDQNFVGRKIVFNINRLNNKQVANELSCILKPKMNILSEDYVRDIKESYIDIGSLNNYSIEDKPTISHEDFNKLFSSLTEKEQYYLFTNLMVCKNYVHLVINNKYILDIMLPKMKPMTFLLKYLLSYSWIMFYYEECLKKKDMKTADTFIFDIETASRLPIFPFIHENPTENPYMPILVSKNRLDPYNNINGIPDYNTSNVSYRNGGICNLDEFIFRMNIFCTGYPQYNLFENFDFKKYNVAISGSIMSACLQRNHPLMNVFTSNNFREYFNEYYTHADIDVMFIAKDIKTFIDNVNIFYTHICTNIFKISINSTITNLVLNKFGYLFISKSFIKNKISKDKTRIKWIEDNLNTEEVKDLFKPFYEELKEKKYKELINGLSDDEIQILERKYPDIYKTLDVEYKICINNMQKEIDFEYTYKYKIESFFLKHPFELFKINCDDFFSNVSQFHLPCVRAYYNGNVYLTPSCISAHLTYMNIDYKYVSGNTDIFEIINKYRLRGFGTWLNNSEIKLMIKYCRNIKKWNDIFKNDIRRHKSISNKIFLKENDKYKIIANLKEFEYKLTYSKILRIRNEDLITHQVYDDLIVINKEGNINPFKQWIINFTFDLLKI